ncbi:MAG: alpha-amylase family glycosyl hydrolase, partial [Pseudomonadota bacterium]
MNAPVPVLRRLYWLAVLAGALSGLAGCITGAPNEADGRYTPQPYSSVTNADWSRNAVIYQLNTRQFTAEGTFAGAEAHLPRIAALGVDIIWLMPIHPIGEVNRKGTLGSPYSVKDYRSVNPEFGTVEDLSAFVATAHDLGMKVILDWVANHSAWDNHLTQTHPHWYETDRSGAFQPPLWTDWGDVIDLNFDDPELRQYMTEAMVYWVREVGVDGFRADVA